MDDSESLPLTSAEQADDQRATRAHHVSKILDEVLAEPGEGAASLTAAPAVTNKRRGARHPMVLDLVLAFGLIFAIGGFSAGLLHMYVNHLADQSLKRNDCEAAIALLQGLPLPNYLMPQGSEGRELFDEALYRDAREKLKANPEDALAIKELEKIEPGSSYFAGAQDILADSFKPAPITLQIEALKEELVSAADLKKMQDEQAISQAENQ
jgi:hypothetical protein